jgi:hypothetical protein
VLFSCGVVEVTGLIEGATLIVYDVFFLNKPRSGLLVVSVRLCKDLLIMSKLVLVTRFSFRTSDYLIKHVVSLGCFIFVT